MLTHLTKIGNELVQHLD